MQAERLVRSGSSSLLGSAFAAVAALALTVLVGNGLGAYGTGVFFQAVGVFTIASHVLRLGTTSSLVRMISEQHAFGRRGEMWRSVVIGVLPVLVVATLAAGVISVFSWDLADWLGAPAERDNLAGLLREMAPFLVLGAVFAVLGTATRMARGITAYTVIQSILLPLSRLILVGAAIVLVWDAFGVFRAWLAVIPVWLLVTILVLARPLVLDWRQRHSAQESFGTAAGRFWRFSASRALGGTFEILLEWSDVLIVAALASPAEAGVYAVATRTIRVGQIVDRAMRLAVSPTISQMLARSELRSARDLHTSVTRAMILSNWPYYLVLATMGPALLSIFGPEFEDGAVVLTILAGSMMIAAAAGMLQSLLLQGGKSTWQMFNKGLALGVSIGLNLLLVPLIGIVGAAVTWAVGILLDTSIASWQVHKGMGVSLEPRKLLLAMSIPLAVFGCGGLVARLAFGSTVLNLVLSTIALGVIYLAILWILRARLGIAGVWREVPVLGRWADGRPSAPKESRDRSPSST